MRKSKKTSVVPPLSPTATEEEVVEWLNTYDLDERLVSGVSEIVEAHSDLDHLLQEALYEGNMARLDLRVPPAMKAVLHKLARQRTTDPVTLARIWLSERLQQELRDIQSKQSARDL
jgi:hypothetical protein